MTAAAHVALSFDDGPDPVSTPLVLDALRRADARATFFVLGPAAAAHPGLVARARAEGHAVGLHAQRHVRHTELTAADGEADARAALATLRAQGVAPALWRTPWGARAPWTEEVAATLGLELVGWTADTHDWRGDRAEAMLEHVAPGLVGGAVVLAHDGIGPGAQRADCSETARWVGLVVAAARVRGLEVGPVAPSPRAVAA